MWKENLGVVSLPPQTDCRAIRRFASASDFERVVKFLGGFVNRPCSPHLFLRCQERARGQFVVGSICRLTGRLPHVSCRANGSECERVVEVVSFGSTCFVARCCGIWGMGFLVPLTNSVQDLWKTYHVVPNPQCPSSMRAWLCLVVLWMTSP